MISIQTNVASLEAQNFVNINSNFQNTTIEQLSSGYRINKSGDDAAGLATANQYAGTVATLTQGVLNANNSLGALQIADGGLSNISTILGRLQTLATESASSTFAGNRATVNTEYQGLLQEINRQAAAIGMNTGGANNIKLVTYVGGASTQANSQVSVDLSGANNAVDSAALGIQNTSVAGGGTTFATNTTNLNNNATMFVSGNAAASQTFTFQVATPTGEQQVQAVVNGSVAGVNGASVIAQLNAQLNQYGITASVASAPGTATDQTLEFGGQTAFTVSAGAIAGGGAAGSVVVPANLTAVNTANYNLDSSSAPGGAFAAFVGATETVNFASGTGSQTLTLNSGNAGSLQQAVAYLNGQLNGIGIYALQTAAGDISFQSANSFNVNEINYTANGSTGNLFGGATGGLAGSTGAVTVTAPAAGASDTGNAITALSALTTAISNLGLTQGIVGAGENKLNYATNLAQSQITNFSAAESRIRDANIAQEAANLTKAQVLQQASLAALAQANTAPQAVLALLKG